MIRFTKFLAIFMFLNFSCSSKRTNIKKSESNFIDTTKIANNKNSNKSSNYFPFKIDDSNGHYTIIVETESPEIYQIYTSFFNKFGYSGNGYCWEGHIIQILEKLNPGLLNHINFDPEAGSLFSIVDTKENQIIIVELLSPIFSDLIKLEEYVKKADRSRIDDK